MVHIGMLKLTYDFAIRNGISDLVTLGLPHLKNLYRIGFFRPVGLTCHHPTWGAAELMHFDLARVKSQYQNSRNLVARLLFRTSLPNIIV